MFATWFYAMFRLALARSSSPVLIAAIRMTNDPGKFVCWLAGLVKPAWICPVCGSCPV